MNIKRISRHLLLTHWHVNRAFPQHTCAAIEQAISASMSAHVGQIRFAAEGALHSVPLFKGQSASERALDVFSQLRVWDTPANNGLLIYLLLADRTVVIVADRGIDSKVGARDWEKICQAMESAFEQGHYEVGVISGIQSVTQHLSKHYPGSGAYRNETPVLRQQPRPNPKSGARVG